MGAPGSPQRDRALGWRGTEPGARHDGRFGCQFFSQVRGQQPLRIYLQPRSRSTSGSDRNQGGLLHRVDALAAVIASLAAFEGSGCDALELPRPARRALAAFPCQTLSFSTFAQILSSGPETSLTCTSASGQPAQLFYYLKEVRERWGADYNIKGALPWPRELAPPVRC